MRYSTAVAILLGLCATAVAGLGLPKLPDRLPTDKIPIRIPGLDKILEAEPALTTSLDDARFEVPYLDDFDPPAGAPLTEVPYDHDQGWPLVMGGTVEHYAQSYCLHAGGYGPGSGEGYLDAPLKGPLAGMVQDVLGNSVRHLDVPQADVQGLVWAILARARFSDLSPELQEAGRRLLSREQIRKLDGGALARVPAEVRDQVFGRLPPLARTALEAEANLRDLLASHADFGALEQIAVLSGDPPPDEGDREVPEGRWSFDPGGYFVRYFPDGYTTTRLQVYVPEQLDVTADAKGRIVSIADRHGNRIETQYAGDAEPAWASEDSRVRAYAFSLVRLAQGTPGGEPQVVEIRDRGWTLVGLPSQEGRPGEPPGLEGLADRYAAAVELAGQWRPLLGAVADACKLKGDSRYLAEGLANLMDLAHYFAAVSSVVQGAEGVPDWAAPHLLLVKRAWMTTLGLLCQGPAEEHDGAEASRWRLQPLCSGPLRLASLGGLPGAGLQAQPEVRFAWSRRPYRMGPPKLPKFKPDKRGAMPGKRGRQRLGQSARSPGDCPGKQAFNRARKVLDWAGAGGVASNIALKGPVAAARDGVGFAIPKSLFGSLLDFNMSTAHKISQQLGGDPPRPDFRELTVPGLAEVPRLEPGPDMPPARAAALNALMEALTDLVAKLRAAQIAQDRCGGALEAGDEDWAGRQATAATAHKRAAGRAMLVMAERLRAVLAESRAEGVEDVLATPAALRAYQEHLRQGFSAGELRAGHLAGMTDAELEELRQHRLSVDPDEAAGSLMAMGDEAAAAFEELGGYLASLSDASAFAPAVSVAP